MSFDLDANGIISVSAKDKATGKSQNIRIEAGSGLSKEEIERMKAEAKANEESDKKVREEVEKLNAADGMIFNSEKQLKEYGDKIPEDKKGAIESALKSLKDAHGAKDFGAIDSSLESLNAAWQAASQDMYNASQGADGATANAGGAENANSTSNEGNVTDAEFEEVK